MRIPRLLICLFVLSGFLTPEAFSRPSFTIGSDPYETVFAFPHDILEWPERAVFATYTPQTMPWQGDVTNIHNRPSESYTSNYQEIEFAPPYDYEGDPADVYSWARVSSYIHDRGFRLGGITTTRFGKVFLEIGNQSRTMDLEAGGVARANESGEYILVPFEGETRGSQDDYDFKLIYANEFLDNPLGVKLRFTRKTADEPDGFIRFERDGTTYNVPHLTWGWATTGCNHIFGYSSINADAFFQNHYSVFSGRRWDLQLSYEHQGNWKSGIRYRTTREEGDNYGWEYDEGSDFEGDYYVDEYWRDRNTDKLLRAYSKARFWEVGDLDAGLLFFAQYQSKAQMRVNRLIEADPDSREGQSGFALEVNPYFNYELDRGFVDGGFLFEYARSGLENTETRWNSASHTDEEGVLWSTSPYMGWSTYWEDFSKGREWFLATGFEANASVGVYRGFSALLRLTILRQFTHTKKLYGESEVPDGKHSYQFFQTYRRDDYRSEMWMTGMCGVSCDWGAVTVYLTQDLPTAYLLKQKTKLADNEVELFEHEKRQMWQVQRPSGTRLFMVYRLQP